MTIESSTPTPSADADGAAWCGFGAAVRDAGEPAWTEAVIVFRWGRRFFASGVNVFR